MMRWQEVVLIDAFCIMKVSITGAKKKWRFENERYLSKI